MHANFNKEHNYEVEVTLSMQKASNTYMLHLLKLKDDLQTTKSLSIQQWHVNTAFTRMYDPPPPQGGNMSACKMCFYVLFLYSYYNRRVNDTKYLKTC
jgi:hypothetical protein